MDGITQGLVIADIPVRGLYSYMQCIILTSIRMSEGLVDINLDSTNFSINKEIYGPRQKCFLYSYQLTHHFSCHCSLSDRFCNSQAVNTSLSKIVWLSQILQPG